MFGAGLELADPVHHEVGELIRTQECVLLNDLAELLGPKHLAFRVLSVGEAIAEEDDGVAGTQRERELLVRDIGEEAEGKALGMDGLHFAIAGNEWLHRDRKSV